MKANPNMSCDSSSCGFTRREFAVGLATVFSSLGVAKTPFGTSNETDSAALLTAEEISHSAEAIHMEVSFHAAPARVYDALTDAKQFNQVIQRSAAMKSMGLSAKPVEISREPGGTFSAFGGYVTGRQLELLPHKRIVQAWRAGGWAPGIYSIARFELSAEGKDTKLVFDHTGFPQGDGEHLLEGWKSNYWEPLEKFLAQPT